MSLIRRKTNEEKRQEIRNLNHRLLFDDLNDFTKKLIKDKIEHLRESTS